MAFSLEDKYIIILSTVNKYDGEKLLKMFSIKDGPLGV